jgi:hypothetical protein
MMFPQLELPILTKNKIKMRTAKHLYRPWLVNKKHNIQQLHMSCKDTHQCLSEKPETKEAHF